VKVSPIPDSLRAEFEESGEVVIAQILARPLTQAVGTLGVPKWAGEEDGRRYAQSTFFLVLAGVLIGLYGLIHK
jgi:hypothetical protein